MSFEMSLIEHCSPTLACLKTGNLFTISFSALDKLNESVNLFNAILEDKGVNVFVLRVNSDKNTALIYVYRKSTLQKDLENPNIVKFLSCFGYKNCDLNKSLEILKFKLNKYEAFPHEIGIFLGYPLDDIEAFISNNGRNFTYCGYWKVYKNSKDSIKKFQNFDKCRELYRKLWERGYSIGKLTVTA